MDYFRNSPPPDYKQAFESVERTALLAMSSAEANDLEQGYVPPPPPTVPPPPPTAPPPPPTAPPPTAEAEAESGGRFPWCRQPPWSRLSWYELAELLGGAVLFGALVAGLVLVYSGRKSCQDELKQIGLGVCVAVLGHMVNEFVAAVHRRLERMFGAIHNSRWQRMLQLAASIVLAVLLFLYSCTPANSVDQPVPPLPNDNHDRHDL